MNVLEAARARVSMVFDRFDRVEVSVSGGKDSTVLLYLAQQEAVRRNRRVTVFFLDQEAEYESTIAQVDWMMRLPGVDPYWVQAPMRLTNATSHEDVWLHAWRDGEEWLRPLSPIGTHYITGAPDRFYDFFPWHERQSSGTGFLVGIRARESMHRWRATRTKAALPGVPWSTKAEGDENFRLYPIFDWWDGDVWRYILDHGLPYNAAYDRMWKLGFKPRQMRVSNLIHEQAFRSLATLQVIEPDTYERLLKRLGGVHAAALYADDEQVFGADRLPAAFASWRAYRDYLLDTTPAEHVKRFRKRFAKHETDEVTCRGHVRQILTNDWENNVPVLREKASRLRELWWDRL